MTTKPINETILSRSLDDGLSPSDWYMTLNRRCFFWCSEGRLVRLLGAKAYRSREHDVLYVDTASLLQAHGDVAEVSRINSGCALYIAPRRGRATFVPLAAVPNRGFTPVELVVPYAVPLIADHVVKVIRTGTGAAENILWERGAG